LNIGLFRQEVREAWSRYGAAGVVGVLKQQVVRRWPYHAYHPVQPLRVQVEVTSRCNLACIMCARTHHIEGPGEHMSLDTFRHLMQNFASVREVHLQGWGEPFLHPRIFEMIALADPRRRFVSTNSNITVINERIARRIFESGLTALRLSLDGASAETFEMFRPPADFDRVMKNLQTLLDVRRELQAFDTEVTLVVVCQQGNLSEMPDFVDLVARLGIDELRVQEVREFGDQPETRRLGEEDMTHVKEVCAALAARHHIRLDWSAYREWAGEICQFPWRQLYIRANGKVSLCCEKFFTEADEDTYGDVNVQTGHQIWNGPKYRQARRELASGGFPVACRLCPLYGFPDRQLATPPVVITRGERAGKQKAGGGRADG
jgi:MoaA/NifB/PqqE/SkfB family radical SAM enzyme